MLVDYNQTFPLNEEAAAALGVKPGIPVVPTNSDGGLNQVGSGAMEEGVMTFSVGHLWCYSTDNYAASNAGRTEHLVLYVAQVLVKRSSN